MDPIKPFTTLLRSLRRAGKTDAPRTTQPGTADSPAASASIATVPAVQGRLQSRLSTLAPWDEKRARELFVESTLLHEFGAELAEDPAFFELVQRVSTHIGGEASLRARLDQLLRDLGRGPR